MTNDETKDDMTTSRRMAINRRIVKVMAEILADKYECTINVKFKDAESRDGGGRDESAAGENQHVLCGNGN